MAIQILLPQLGESVTEGTIVRWLKQPGEQVARDEPLVEIVTDKVNVEVPSLVAGKLVQIIVPEGDTVPVGTPIAALEEIGVIETNVAGDGAGPGTGEMIEVKGQSEPMLPLQPAVRTESDIESGNRIDTAIHNSIEPGEREPHAYSPAVRRLAAEHGIDPALLSGTGIGGRVTKLDMEAEIAARTAAAALAPSVELKPARPMASTIERESELQPVSPIRRMIAEHMVRSKFTAPHAWTAFEIDMTNVVRTRAVIQAAFRQQEGFELTYLPFTIHAVCKALAQYPALNASWLDNQIAFKKHMNIGIAVALDDGLIVPVIHDANMKSIAELAGSIHDLASRARASKLHPDEVQGGTFTVNNTGSFGSVLSYPIINYPQAAMLTMEAIVKRPVVISDGENDSIAVRSMMFMTLAFDHRVLDGLTAGRFMQRVKTLLEQTKREDTGF